MKKQNTLALWSLRFSTSRGWHAYKERDCDNEHQGRMWLEVFQGDEPGVEFVLATKSPKFDPETRAFKRS